MIYISTGHFSPLYPLQHMIDKYLRKAQTHLTPAGDLSKNPFLKFWNRDCGRDDIKGLLKQNK